MNYATWTRNDVAFQGYSKQAPKGPSFLTMVKAKREADRMFRAWPKENDESFPDVWWELSQATELLPVVLVKEG